MNRVLDFAKKKVPFDWQEKSLGARLAYQTAPGEPVERRRTVCALEVWCECFGKDRRAFTQRDARQINAELAKLENYRRSTSAYCGPYGRQRAFVRQFVPEE